MKRSLINLRLILLGLSVSVCLVSLYKRFAISKPKFESPIIKVEDILAKCRLSDFKAASTKDLLKLAIEKFESDKFHQAHCIFAYLWTKGSIEIFPYWHISAYRGGNYTESLGLCDLALKYRTYLSKQTVAELESTRIFYFSLAQNEWSSRYLKSQFENIGLNSEENRKRINQLLQLHDFYYDCKTATRGSRYDHPHRSSRLSLLFWLIIHNLQDCLGISNRKARQLICRFNTRNRHPLLILSPAKEEILSWIPKIVVFHDIVTEKQVDRIKALSESNLKISGIFNSYTHEVENNFDVRRVESAWVEMALIPRISRQIEATIGLKVIKSDQLQVARYGITGHYRWHYDAFSDETLPEGDRIATLLIYLNDVEQGGATIFNQLGITVVPNRRSALLFYNLLPNGQVDRSRSLHAACPVEKGVKWIANLWLNYNPQFAHKPCGVSEYIDFS